VTHLSLIVNRSRYEAFGMAIEPITLDVRRTGELPYNIDYRDIEIYHYVEGHTYICLYAAGMMIDIRGRQLAALLESFRLGCCEFVQQFDAQEFAPPSHISAPLIETIVIRQGKRAWS
jgi:hypothetical protein